MSVRVSLLVRLGVAGVVAFGLGLAVASPASAVSKAPVLLDYARTYYATPVLADSTVFVTPGRWSGKPSISYQWQRCSEDSPNKCTPIDGATPASYTVTAADSGNYVQAVVIAATSTRTATTESEYVRVGHSNEGTTAPFRGYGAPPRSIHSINNGGEVTLHSPAVARRGKAVTYSVSVDPATAGGTVSFSLELRKGLKPNEFKYVKADNVPVVNGAAQVTLTAPKSWPAIPVRVNAMYYPAAGSGYKTSDLLLGGTLLK